MKYLLLLLVFRFSESNASIAQQTYSLVDTVIFKNGQKIGRAFNAVQGIGISIVRTPTHDSIKADTANMCWSTGATSGTYGMVAVNNKGQVLWGKRQEVYSGTTNGSGNYTVTFSTPYSVAPNIQASISNQSAVNQSIRVSSVSTTGFTVNVYQRNSVTLLSVEVLLAATVNVSGATVDVLVTEK